MDINPNLFLSSCKKNVFLAPVICFSMFGMRGVWFWGLSVLDSCPWSVTHKSHDHGQVTFLTLQTT